jgi:GTP-binding protein HflX
VFGAARTGEGVVGVVGELGRLLPDRSVVVDVLLPYDRGDLVSALHERGRVVRTEYEPEGTRILAKVAPEFVPVFEPFLTQAEAVV